MNWVPMYIVKNTLGFLGIVWEFKTCHLVGMAQDLVNLNCEQLSRHQPKVQILMTVCKPCTKKAKVNQI